MNYKYTENRKEMRYVLIKGVWTKVVLIGNARVMK